MKDISAAKEKVDFNEEYKGGSEDEHDNKKYAEDEYMKLFENACGCEDIVDLPDDD